MKNTLLISILAVCALIGCSPKQQQQFEEITLVEEKLPPVEPLQLEKIDLPEDYIMGSVCYTYQDSVLLVLKEGDPKPLTHMLTIFNLNTGAKIGEFFTRGKGPQELLSPFGRMSHKWLDIKCLSTYKFISFNIDSALILGNKYNPNITTCSWHSVNDFVRFDDTSFLITNQLFFDGCEEYKSDPSIPEFFKLSHTGKIYPTPEKIDFKEVKIYPPNVTGGNLLVNQEKQKLVYCFHFQPFIKIFDLNMNQIKQISGPEPNDGKYEIIMDNMLFFDEKVGYNYYYFGSYCDEKYIFSANYRVHNLPFYRPGLLESGEAQRQNTEIFQLDWEGNVIARYSAKGYIIYHISYSGATNTLYLWLIDRDGERGMYKAKLN